MEPGLEDREQRRAPRRLRRRQQPAAMEPGLEDREQLRVLDTHSVSVTEPRWSPVSRTGNRGAALDKAAATREPRWSPVSRTGNRRPSRVTRTGVIPSRDGARSRGPGTAARPQGVQGGAQRAAMEPGLEDREQSPSRAITGSRTTGGPRWSPVSRTGNRQTCRTTSPPTCRRDGARSRGPGTVRLEGLHLAQRLEPRWSPVSRTGNSGQAHRKQVAGHPAAMEPGLEDREQRPAATRADAQTGRDGARSRGPGTADHRRHHPRGGVVAAMEPGLEDREQSAGPAPSANPASPRWSPVSRTGNSSTSVSPSCCSPSCRDGARSRGPGTAATTRGRRPSSSGRDGARSRGPGTATGPAPGSGGTTCRDGARSRGPGTAPSFRLGTLWRGTSRDGARSRGPGTARTRGTPGPGPTSCRDGARSRGPGTAAVAGVRLPRLGEPRWSPVSRTGNSARDVVCYPQSFSTPRWSPVSRTGNRRRAGDFPRAVLPAAMEPGLEDREQTGRSRRHRAARTCRDGARSRGPGTAIGVKSSNPTL